MNKIETGMRVYVVGQVKKHLPLSSRMTELTVWKFKEPKEVLVLGKSKRVTGTVRYAYDDWPTFVPDQTHDVWIVMEVNKHNYYRKPFAVFENQIVLENKGTP